MMPVFDFSANRQRTGKSFVWLNAAFGLCLSLFNCPAFGQDGGAAIPLPGSSAVYQTGGDANATWSKGGQGANAVANKSLYQSLPLSAEDAKTRIDELKTLMLVSRPQDIQGRIFNMCEWLADLTEAHNKLANVFARQDATRAQAQAEKSAAWKMVQLKNEAVLLKAELLIKLNRTPEALAPLVEIVSADPKGATGQAAYRHLKELGFSPEAPDGSGAISSAGQQQEHIMVFPNGPSSNPAPPTKKAPSGQASAGGKGTGRATR